EPRTIAERVERVASGVWRWHVLDDRISYESDSYAVRGRRGFVLIDPLPLAPKALEKLAPVEAICLTAACHQRSAWRYRKQFGVKVYAPQGAKPTEERPDARYGAGQLLPGGLRAVHTPGPEKIHYGFLRRGRPAVFFCPDLVMRGGAGRLEFIPAELHDDPAETRASVSRILRLEFSVLCLSHGTPIKRDPQGALRKLIERDRTG
ncbi:MAG: MBL fold metallo-hydrolase, partial [Alphaproteobacteria bacterium]